MAYKLDGIPDEYDEYINYVNGDSPAALRDMLREVCESGAERAMERAAAARRFVREEKNSEKQALKIKKLIDSI